MYKVIRYFCWESLFLTYDPSKFWPLILVSRGNLHKSEQVPACPTIVSVQHWIFLSLEEAFVQETFVKMWLWNHGYSSNSNINQRKRKKLSVNPSSLPVNQTTFIFACDFFYPCKHGYVNNGKFDVPLQSTLVSPWDPTKRMSWYFQMLKQLPQIIWLWTF